MIVWTGGQPGGGWGERRGEGGGEAEGGRVRCFFVFFLEAGKHWVTLFFASSVDALKILLYVCVSVGVRRKAA